MPGTRGEKLLRAIAAAAMVMAVVLGCAEDPLSADRANRDEINTLPDGLEGPLINLDYDSYDEVSNQTVKAGKQTVVAGSRYSLEFMEGSLNRSATITISERHPYIVDVVLEPHGFQFGEPVTLVIDYSGTANDPDVPYFHGKSPAVFWLDEEKGAWVPQAGWDNPSNKTYTVLLSHFSRYAMSDGTGGWESPARPRVRGGKEIVTTK